MNLFLVRHGNTFGPNERPVWVGRNEDLPLAESGVQQADAVGMAFSRQKIVPDKVFAAPLKRTRDFAERIVLSSGWEIGVQIDRCLIEIDYGFWGGLDSDEIRARFGPEDLDAWEQEGKWPPSGVWGSRQEEFTLEPKAFCDELLTRLDDNATVLAVSSNGKLRYFLNLIDGELEKRVESGTVKVGTGNICHLRFSDGKWWVVSWNVNPNDWNLD